MRVGNQCSGQTTSAGAFLDGSLRGGNGRKRPSREGPNYGPLLKVDGLLISRTLVTGRQVFVFIPHLLSAEAIT